MIRVGAERAPQERDLRLDVAARRPLVGELDEERRRAPELRLAVVDDGEVGRDVQRRQRLLGDRVVRTQPHRLFEPHGRLPPVAQLVGEQPPERHQDLAALVAARRRLQLDLVQPRHHRPVAERAIDAPPGVDGEGVVGIDLERALVRGHRLIDAPEVALVERAELEVDGRAQPRLGRPLFGLRDGALVQLDRAEQVAALAGQLRSLTVGVRRGSAARRLRLLQ